MSKFHRARDRSSFIANKCTRGPGNGTLIGSRSRSVYLSYGGGKFCARSVYAASTGVCRFSLGEVEQSAEHAAEHRLWLAQQCAECSAEKLSADVEPQLVLVIQENMAAQRTHARKYTNCAMHAHDQGESQARVEAIIAKMEKLEHFELLYEFWLSNIEQ